MGTTQHLQHVSQHGCANPTRDRVSKYCNALKGMEICGSVQGMKYRASERRCSCASVIFGRICLAGSHCDNDKVPGKGALQSPGLRVNAGNCLLKRPKTVKNCPWEKALHERSPQAIEHVKGSKGSCHVAHQYAQHTFVA